MNRVNIYALGGWPTFTFFVKVGTATSEVTGGWPSLVDAKSNHRYKGCPTLSRSLRKGGRRESKHHRGLRASCQSHPRRGPSRTSHKTKGRTHRSPNRIPVPKRESERQFFRKASEPHSPKCYNEYVSPFWEAFMDQGARKDWRQAEPPGWRNLCNLAQAQSDPNKLAVVIDSINRLLARHERWAKTDSKRDSNRERQDQRI